MSVSIQNHADMETEDYFLQVAGIFYLAITSASSRRSPGCIASGPADLDTSSDFNSFGTVLVSISMSCHSAEKSFLAQSGSVCKSSLHSREHNYRKKQFSISAFPESVVADTPEESLRSAIPS